MLNASPLRVAQIAKLRYSAIMETYTGLATLSDGGQLYYEMAGRGDTVLFIHGFSLDTRMWDDQFEVFAQRYRVIRFDLRGFGKSSAPTGDYSRVEDLEALLNYLNAGSAHVIGLSLGGGVAIDFALERPRLTRSLVAVDSALGGYPWTTDFNTRAREVGLEQAKENWLAHRLFGPANRNPAVAARLREMVLDWSGWQWLNSDPGRAPNPLPYQRLKDIAAPTLAILGEYDLPDFQDVAATLVSKTPNARKIVLPGVGHMSNMEAPDEFNEGVLSFIEGYKSKVT